jgi:ubiquinone/menaquinone biosynthesis C-methylase UbiE
LLNATVSSEFPETADVETSSENYAQRFSGNVGAWFLKVQEKATLRMLTPYPKATILDVGGGHGQVTQALIEHGHDLTVLGSAPDCRTRIEQFVTTNECKFDVGNILDLPYGDQTFDIVMSYRLLPHVTQWKQFLSELARVARKAVILDYPEVRSVNYIAPYLFRFKKKLEGNTRPYTCFRESELLDVFQTLNFVKSERFAEFFFPMVLHRKLKSLPLSKGAESIARRLGLTAVFGSPVILKLIRDYPQ